ncbi:uncharacterized protein LOC115887335 [Sitophilus oryzae]|uniref:Uncharacterized protein LOC115887335 n=1 Tax=Sitophilus oryzae TaxID=7048 RepID=A0A6J2YI91_SITOR|nr:uncharacterized protein LOC115887335 [Sitophilus oryzae]
MAKVSSGIFQFILIAGALGVVQGLLWLGLGIAVVIIKSSITVCQDENLQSDSIGIGCAIYNVFIKDSEDDHRIINAEGFIIFVYIYLGLSLLWFFVSSFSIWGTLRAGNNSKAKNVVWSATTTVISLIDVILMSLLVYDYINYEGGRTIAENVAFGIVLSIAVRGYVLWIINLIFAIVLGKSAYNQYRNAPTNNQSYIDAFDTSLRPPWETDNDFQQNMSNEEYNSGFINDTDDTYKSNSFNKIRIGSNQFNNNNNTEANKESTNFSRNPLSNPSNQNWPKIGPIKDVNKSTYIGDGLGLSTNISGRPLSDFPQNSNTQFLHESKGADITQLHSRVSKNNDSPYIPDPDYSPPGSPRVKGVLRPRSNYVI